MAVCMFSGFSTASALQAENAASQTDKEAAFFENWLADFLSIRHDTLSGKPFDKEKFTGYFNEDDPESYALM